MKEAGFYQKKANNKVECRLCSHFCLINENESGLCGVRVNEKGVLKNYSYGYLSAQNIEEIEKNYLHHFFPGTRAYTIGSLGCNFNCLHCDNFIASQPQEPLSALRDPDICTPERIIEEALGNDCQSICYAYNEPTINLEYYLEIMRLAQLNNLQNVWISNGYQSPESLTAIAPYLSATCISLKSMEDFFYRNMTAGKPEPILENLKFIKQEQIHLEISTLIIPSYNDNVNDLSRIADFIAYELDGDTPWHLCRFYPQSTKDLKDLPATGEDIIYEAYEIGKDAGLKYIYVSNLPGDQKENTYCPKCNGLAIRRFGSYIERLDNKGHCPECDRSLDIVE